MTDLIAVAWLPRIMKKLNELYPNLEIEPVIDLTSGLTDRLSDRRIDFAIFPRSIHLPQFLNIPLGSFELAWLCSPGLLDGRVSLSEEELCALPLITQSRESVLRSVLHSIHDRTDVTFSKRIVCNNMAALADLAVAGLGTTILPIEFFREKIECGKLILINTPYNLPKLDYYITFRNDYYRSFFLNVAYCCQEICDLNKGPSGAPS